jgi:copper chaperone NosL
MIITEPEYASQILNKHGRAYSFDSIECMAAYDIRNEATAEMDIHSRWVPDFEGNTDWLPAEKAVYLHSETLHSPMGLFLSAYPDNQTADSFKNTYQGDILTYDGVKQLVNREWNPASRADMGNQSH